MTARRPTDPPEIALARAAASEPPPPAEEADEAEEDALLLIDAGDAPPPGAESLATGREAIVRAAKHAPAGPGVYRMIAGDGTVLYVGKAKSIRKRVLSYTRPVGHTNRIARMIAATASMEFVSTRTEPEALLLEANLIKQLKPRFNVLLRDDKSFPYILITADHAAPQIAKHRGARNRPGDYYGPFASVWAVDRTINALERAFLLRSCSDSYYENRTRPCLLFQIKRCAGPCTGEIGHAEYAELVREARAFLSGRSRAVKEELAHEMEQAAEALEFERAARLRDRLAALSAVQGSQGINPRGVEEADVFACHQQGGATCIEVFFFRTGQNWGNRAYYPRADRSLTEAEVLGAFLSQFYEDKPCPRLVLLSHKVEEQALIAEALSEKAGYKVEIAVPQRGEKRDLIDHALQNAREALGRTLAESATQARLLEGVAAAFSLKAPPQRIEVYDNSHIMGTNAVGGMIVAGPEGFRKSQYRKFNIRSTDLVPGDDFGMMREVLTRRFSRLLKEAPRAAEAASQAPVQQPSPEAPSPQPSPARGEGVSAVTAGDGGDPLAQKAAPAAASGEAGTLARRAPSPQPSPARGGGVPVVTGGDGGDPLAQKAASAAASGSPGTLARQAPSPPPSPARGEGVSAVTGGEGGDPLAQKAAPAAASGEAGTLARQAPSPPPSPARGEGVPAVTGGAGGDGAAEAGAALAASPAVPPLPSRERAGVRGESLATAAPSPELGPVNATAAPPEPGASNAATAAPSPELGPVKATSAPPEAGARKAAAARSEAGASKAVAAPPEAGPDNVAAPTRAAAPASASQAPDSGAPAGTASEPDADAIDDDAPDALPDATGASPWPDLVLIDGGLGQLNAARSVLEELGITDVPLVGIAKGVDRDAGREQFFVPGRPPFRMEPRDPVLYFIQRLRDEAHRFAIGSHRARRKKDITEAGLQAIPGVGPTRKRALLRHFGTLKAIERASLADLEQVDGINAGTAKAVYDYFHERPGS